MRTTKVRYAWNLLNGLLFFWHVVLSGNKDDQLYFAAQARLGRAIARQRRLEEFTVWGAAVILVLLDWRRCFWFAVLPQFYAKYCILSLNFLQHDGCEMLKVQFRAELHRANGELYLLQQWVSHYPSSISRTILDATAKEA